MLTQQGHKVIWVTSPSKGGKPDDPADLPELGLPAGISLQNVLRYIGVRPDLFLYVEPMGLIPEELQYAPFPTACIISDFHNHLASRLNLALLFDHVFVYHRNYIPFLRQHPSEYIHWLPYACDLELFRPLPVERDLDVAFVGQLNNAERKHVMRTIASRWIVNEQRYYLQEEIPNIYSRAKIVVNLPLKDDLNFRFFEAMSCGALLLTRRIANGQEVLFEEGVHFAAFETESELYEKIDYYLKHDIERNAIAAAGLAEIQAHHRIEQRLKQIVDTVTQMPQLAAPIRRMKPRNVALCYARLYESWGMTDPNTQLIRNARRTGQPWIYLMPPAIRTFFRSTLR